MSGRRKRSRECWNECSPDAGLAHSEHVRVILRRAFWCAVAGIPRELPGHILHIALAQEAEFYVLSGCEAVELQTLNSGCTVSSKELCRV